jgi:hypothetical protein
LERGRFETSSPFISRCFRDFSADLDSPEKSHLGEKDFVVRLRGPGGVMIWWRFGFAGENIALQGFRKSPESSNSTPSSRQSGLCASPVTTAENRGIWITEEKHVKHTLTQTLGHGDLTMIVGQPAEMEIVLGLVPDERASPQFRARMMSIISRS